MADDRNEIRHINWGEVFSFTHIFKSFRLAIHPSKLLLAFLAIALTWLAAQGLQFAWKASDTRGYAMPNEVARYARMETGFNADRQRWEEGRPAAAASLLIRAKGSFRSEFEKLAQMPFGHFRTAYNELIEKADLPAEKRPTDEVVKEAKGNLRGVLADAQTEANKSARVIGGDEGVLEKAYLQAKEAIKAEKELPEDKNLSVAEKKDKAQAQLEKDYEDAKHAVATTRATIGREAETTRGDGLFTAFANYEWFCIYNSLAAVADGDIVDGLPLTARPALDANPATATTAELLAVNGDKGFLAWVIDALRGFAWLIDEHVLFGIILLVVTLAIWALLGGAIHRIAALHAARDEKISMVQALRFSISKWPSFFTAPLIPLAVVFFFASFIMLGGLLSNLWGAGSVLVGVMLLLAILMGLIIAFIIVGLVSGFGLMYPTIAVEGSDSFDAISRSFAYVYARPWRAALYSLVGLVYGVACYLFVRLFGWITLATTHEFLRWGSWQDSATGATDKVAIMWPAPTFSQLLPDIPWAYLDGFEKVGAVFIWIWVALIVGLVNAFLLSFASSCNTIIYLLLRRKVDATELDDVFVQEPQEKSLAEAATAAAAGAPAATAPATTAPTTEAVAAPSAPADTTPPAEPKA